MQLGELIGIEELGLRMLAGPDGAAGRAVRRVFTTDLRDPGRYLTGDDLVLTGLIWHRGAEDSAAFVARLAERGACALGAGQVLLGHVPEDLIAACRRYGLPLFAVPEETSFATITEHVSRRLSGEWGSALSRVLGRHRRLVSAVAEGAGLDALFRLLADDLGVRCWLVTPTGRVIAGTAPLEHAAVLARGYLTAERLPRVLRAEGEDVTVYPVASGAGHRVTSWFLACAGDEAGWPDEQRESVRELVADVALERARLEAAGGVEHRLAVRVIELVAGGDTGSAELTSLSRTLGLDGAGEYAAVALRLTGDGAGEDPARVARGLLGELADAGPGTRPGAVIASGADLPERLGAGRVRSAVAVIPLADAAPADGPSDRVVEGAANGGADGAASGKAYSAAPPDGAAVRLARDVRAGAGALECGLGGLRMTAGVSGPARGLAGLRVAVEEALSALRLADARPGRAVVVSAGEIDSHVLLLASVPDEVRRSFRDRLLGPLLDYDERHGSRLVPTLEAFLAASGSWRACAAQLHVHVNTLRYRIQRIERITGRDLGALENRVDFFLATRAGGGDRSWP